MSTSRRRLLLAGIAAVPLVARTRAARAQDTDVARLERLLALEHRLGSAYEAALRRDAIEPALGEQLHEHERQHVRGLEQALRARGGLEPRATVPLPELGASLASRPAFARFALGLEAEAVAAYEDALARLRSPRLGRPLGSIMACGAQHGVALRGVLGEPLLGPGA